MNPVAGRVGFPAEGRASSQVTPLNGLRGLAALMVFVFHAALCIVSLNFAGSRAIPVQIFFGLSGVLLTASFARQRDGEGRRTYWSVVTPRLIGLYVPSWVAIALSVSLTLTLADRIRGPVTPWIAQHVELSVGRILGGASLFGSGATSNGVMWTMKFFVVMTLVLPVMAMIGDIVRRAWSRGSRDRALVVCVVLVAVFSTQALPLWRVRGASAYVLVFLCGVVLSKSLLENESLREPDHRGSGWGYGVPVVVLLGWRFVSSTIVGYWTGPLEIARRAVEVGVTCAGMTLVILGSMRVPRWSRFFSGRALQWLGSRSFSLYLVHAPLLWAYSALVGGRPSVVGLLIVAGPVVLLTTELFERTVVLPTRRMVRRIAGAFRTEQTGESSVDTPHGKARE